MTNAPAEVEEEVTEEATEAELEGKLIDAEVLLRHAWDLLDDLAIAERIPRKMVDTIEKIHDELVAEMPDD